jgi:4,5-DOPA dioxygenase extradiol
MNALEQNEFSTGWQEIALALPRPRAILCISAHWETRGTFVTSMERPTTIHDFYGFPDALRAMTYPAPGAPQWADLTRTLVRRTEIKPDYGRGLDHGTWSVLARMYPTADIPTYQMSLDRSQPPQHHYELAGEWQELRDPGVLIIGSGNVVHNLPLARPNVPPYDWAIEFDHRVRDLVKGGDHRALIEYQGLGPSARRSIPTAEHYLPLLCALALQRPDESPRFRCEKIVFGSVAMRAITIG